MKTKKLWMPHQTGPDVPLAPVEINTGRKHCLTVMESNFPEERFDNRAVVIDIFPKK